MWTWVSLWHRHCVFPPPHPSNLCDTWPGSIDMREICQPPCLLTVCPDSLAVCLFTHCLGQSRCPRSFSLPSRSHEPLNRSLCTHIVPFALTFPENCMCCKVMSQQSILKSFLKTTTRTTRCMGLQKHFESKCGSQFSFCKYWAQFYCLYYTLLN